MAYHVKGHHVVVEPCLRPDQIRERYVGSSAPPARAGINVAWVGRWARRV